ncbi:hypothetical protein CIK05_12140 [Bdellovibrio sp. qaytius]|nr:hypothetical protein CIK05_12140 [Bdellovibrio sp. qaytius]
MRLSLMLICLTLFAPAMSFAAPKNICTATLNSNEEAELFKKHLNPADWNFIELTDNALNKDDNQWLQKSCEKKIKCDILVVSGHFGGTFFGKSPFRLSVDDLETASCNTNCNGIIYQPKEVFLFGCNTLASKDKDRRTPEEYMRVLLEDGFSQAQASQIVSFRYSGFGDSFKTKMTQIFAKTPRIYGFSSIGPAGNTVEPYLDKYLSSTKAEYAQFDKYTAKQSTKPNTKFLEALKKTSVDQAVGGLLNMKRVEEKPYCYIRSPKITNVDKIKYVEKLLSQGDGIKILSHIQNFIHTLKADPTALTAAEKTALESIRHNDKIKNDLMTLLNLDGAVYIPLKTNVINALRDLEVISQEAAVEGMNRILQLDKPFTEEKQNYLCSSHLSANITVDMIPAARFHESAFVIVLTCLTPNDSRITEKLLPNLDPSETDMFLKANTIYAFQRLQSQDPRHHLAIAKVALTPNLPMYVRFSISYVLSQLKSKNPEIPGIISKALQGEDNEAIIRQYSQALSNFN